MYIMKKTEAGDSTVHYFAVESHYLDPKEAKGKDDAVLFEMGRFNRENETDATLAVSVEKAREFAEEILKQCDKIEGNE